MASIVTLTTDFGTRDAYVAQVKGVLLGGCEGVRVVDLTHEIAAHSVMEGALFLAQAVPAFPAGTVHVAVVDPGVGTARRAVAVRLAGQVVVAPDNGLLTVLARAHAVEEARALENPALRREPVSATFEGRDVFAPAAAFVACGGAFAELGPLVEDLVRLPFPEPVRTEAGVRGEVVHVDRFGNAVTSLRRADVGDGALAVEAGGERLRLVGTYADIGPGRAAALFGSGGYLEIAVERGSAAAVLGLAEGSRVLVPRGAD